jgi:hypothetical protein
MPATFSLTNEGDLYLLTVLSERMVAGDIVLYPLTSIFGADADTFAWSDLATYTDPDFKTSTVPALILGPASVLGSLGQLYAYMQWTNWRATNGSGAVQTPQGYVVVDEVLEKVLFCSTIAPGGTVADGAFKDFSLLVTLDNGPGTLP